MPLVADISDEGSFPVFRGCPLKDDPSGSRSGHWCLQAEIQWDEPFPLRLANKLKDSEGHDFIVAFYIGILASMQVDKKKFKRGHTVAILDAERLPMPVIPDGAKGVVVEEREKAAVFPISLKGLLELGRLVKEYCSVTDSKTKCHGCGNIGEMVGMSKCAACQYFFYCNKCQTKGWREMGHKKVCKVVKDPNFKTMIETDYQSRTGAPRFSPV